MIHEAKVLSFMNNIDQIHEWIDRFNNNELDGKELQEFQELLKYDPVLRSEVRLDKELNDMLQQEDLLALRKTIMKVRNDRGNRGPGKKIILLAASILILLIISVLLYLVAGLNPGH